MSRLPMPARALIVAGVSAIAVTACLPTPRTSPTPDSTSTGERQVDYGELKNAVETASPRILEVDELDTWKNGFGQALSVGLTVDSEVAFTADELDVVVEAIWRSLPWEPNTVEIVASAKTPDGEPVDLSAAAESFSPPVVVGEAGQAGVSLLDLRLRYGEWTAP